MEGRAVRTGPRSTPRSIPPCCLHSASDGKRALSHRVRLGRSAWAEADSFTQKLSELSQERLSGFKQWAAERVAGDFDKEVIDRRLDETIGANAVVVFSFTSCPVSTPSPHLSHAHPRHSPSPALQAQRAKLGVRALAVHTCGA